MYKQIVAIILLSAVIILTASYCAQILQWFMDAQAYVASLHKYVFSEGKLGLFIGTLLSYLLLPFFAGGLVAIFYALTKRKFVPWFMQVVWVVWIVQTTALVLYA